MFPKINIEGWDYATSNCRSSYSPVFYFTPDATTMSYININGATNIPIMIGDTNIYDGIHWTRIDKQPATPLYVGFLPVVFGGFPPTNGTCQIFSSPPSISKHKPLSCLVNDCC